MDKDKTHYQQQMEDKFFDPFGCLTITELNNKLNQGNAFIMKDRQSIDLEGENKNMQEFYYDHVISKTKDDPSIFDPKKFKIDTIESVFSEKNVVQLQKLLESGEEDNLLYYTKVNKSIEVRADETLLNNYLYLYKIRSLLCQPCSLQQCSTKMKSEVHKFGAFEVFEMKDSKNKIDQIFFFDFHVQKIYFIQMNQTVVKHFKDIKGVNSFFNDDEINLIIQSDVKSTQHDNKKYKLKYKFQRDLLVNYFKLVIENTKLESNFLQIKESLLNLIQEDIIVPPKAILSYQLKIKVKGEYHNVDFTIGINNIVVHEWLKGGDQQKTINFKIHFLIPFNHPYFYIDSNCEPNQLICKHGSETISFSFNSELEAQNVKETLQAVYLKKIQNDQIYIHIPYIKKFNKEKVSNLQSYLKDKSKQITEKIEHHKYVLSLLLKARYLLDKQGEKLDYEFEEDKAFYNTPETKKSYQNYEDDDEDIYEPEQ
ncbi:hypothetical protein TTHERM_00357030 (macronuclear) [Tetrahymena thermophila SB210]|uniref:Uncharacterized protein n=1 Tax=Tetrahymena thermophila (strain SB210) TaxID=312017 RepID=Q22XW8_TETTS|nr:hypothetical protein TTHERM_00357030 [Tetrahymena thermophila SB210]EAR90256.2 hypothetical protein TTHERM_00357030 [Tetrahymena thermophila SB210]|eukprot:XP_001010501.2 hypothetical protein TTHERM_00357030 [Tetrahymena thermophila SB210]